MNYFAADDGGTSVKWAVITPNFEIVKKGSFPTPYEDARVLAGRIADVAGACGETFRGIGLSVPGTVFDDEDGLVRGGGFLEYLDGVAIGKMLRELCQIPVYVENDGKSCALGEYRKGALAGCKIGVVMVLGTGVGGGIVIDGSIWKGFHSFAGEFSFIQRQPQKTEDMSNRFGMAGGWKNGLLRRVLEAKGLPLDTEMDGEQIFRLINGKDPAAQTALGQYTDDLALQIWNLQAVLDPQVIAIGGGISRQPALMEGIHRSLSRMVEGNRLKQFPVPKVVSCVHGNDANLLGAAYNCEQQMTAAEKEQKG